MNVYLLPHVDGKSFKIGKANCVETRMKQIGIQYFNKEYMYRIQTEDEISALKLENKLHKVFKDFNVNYTGFDGCTEFFDIKCLPSVLSLFTLGVIVGYTVESFSSLGTVRKQKPLKVKKVKIKDTTYKGEDITDDFRRVCFIRYVSYLVNYHYKLTNTDITPADCKIVFKGKDIGIIRHKVIEWASYGNTSLIGKSGESWIVESTLDGMISGNSHSIRDILGGHGLSPNGAKIQACMRRYLNVNTLDDLLKSYNKESGYCEKLTAL